jgi:hypothetical protein
MTTGLVLVDIPLRFRPPIGLEEDRPIAPLDHDAPTPGSVTTRQRISAYLIHVVSARRALAKRGFDVLEVIDVDNWLLSVLAVDAVHGTLEQYPGR